MLLVDFEIDEISQMTKALDKLVKFNQPVVMFCRHIEQKPLSQVIYNFGIKKIDISVVSMGSAGSDYISSILGDLGALLDARVFDMFDLEDFENLDYSDLGRAQKIEVKSMESFILSKTDKNESHKANLKNRIEQILFEYNSSGGKGKMILEQRLALLQGNIAMFRLGGGTKIEQQEIKDKLVDALNSVRNAMKNGVVPGGGTALLHASKLLPH